MWRSLIFFYITMAKLLNFSVTNHKKNILPMCIAFVWLAKSFAEWQTKLHSEHCILYLRSRTTMGRLFFFTWVWCSPDCMCSMNCLWFLELYLHLVQYSGPTRAKARPETQNSFSELATLKGFTRKRLALYQNIFLNYFWWTVHLSFLNRLIKTKTLKKHIVNQAKIKCYHITGKESANAHAVFFSIKKSTSMKRFKLQIPKCKMCPWNMPYNTTSTCVCRFLQMRDKCI